VGKEEWHAGWTGKRKRRGLGGSRSGIALPLHGFLGHGLAAELNELTLAKSRIRGEAGEGEKVEGRRRIECE
jgi:hypothetical protein